MPDNGTQSEDRAGPSADETRTYANHRGLALYLFENRCKAAAHHGVGIGQDLFREGYVVTC
jgi:hypothetical protein